MLRFENVWVADGNGGQPFRASVLIDGGSIVAVTAEKIAGVSAADTVDGRGMVLAPGFIDAHGHSDVSLVAAPEAESKITQGITTEVAGNCGLSAFPITDANREHLVGLYSNYPVDLDWNDYASYRRRLELRHPLMRLACLCGHNTLRAAVAGYETRQLAWEQLDGMKKLLADALSTGARGLSTGLLYVPGKFSSPEELTALLRAVAMHGGVYATHLRSEGNTLLESLAETLECARKAGVKKVQISHFKTAGKANWSKLENAIRMIEAARADGMEVTVDRYPYVESMTQLSSILPSPWDDLGDVELQKRLSLPEARRSLECELRRSRPPEYWRTVRLAATNAPGFKKDCGERFSDLTDDPARLVAELLAADAAGTCGAFSGMSESNLSRILDLEYCMPGSDGNALPADGSLGRAHPRAFGAVAKFIRRRLDATGSIGDAVRRATSLPARVFSLDDRGQIAVGRSADLVLFDPDSIDSPADFRTPHAPSAGIVMTVCRGIPVFRS